MKKITLIIVLTLSACTQQPDNTPDYVNHPARPMDIPKTTRDGTPIEWNWKKQVAYNEGRLWVYRDSLGNALCIIVKTK